MTEEEIEKLVSKTVYETLFQLGLAVEGIQNIEEARKDFAHLRKWRRAVDQVGLKAMLTSITVLISGAVAAMIMAFNEAVSHAVQR